MQRTTFVRTARCGQVIDVALWGTPIQPLGRSEKVVILPVCKSLRTSGKEVEDAAEGDYLRCSV